MSRSEKVCNQIITHLAKKGFTNQVHVKEVERAIVLVRGPDKRTILNWKRALEVLGYLNRQSASLYQIDLKRCPDLIVKMMKGENQKKLM